jgi:hypothetical protein
MILRRYQDCGECRSKMVKRVDPRKNGPPKVYYECYWRRASKKELFISGRKRCILKPIDANEIDRVIINHLIFFITRPPVHKKKVLKMDKRPNETRKRLQLRLRRFRSGARDQCKPDYGSKIDPDVIRLIQKLRQIKRAG